MRNVFAKLWADDNGIVAMEYMLVATVVGLATIVGLHNVSLAINSELTELGQSIGIVDQGWSYSNETGTYSKKTGASAKDGVAETITFAGNTPTLVNGLDGTINVNP